MRVQYAGAKSCHGKGAHRLSEENLLVFLCKTEKFFSFVLFGNLSIMGLCMLPGTVSGGSCKAGHS